jgi:hypothetical protein
MFNFKYYLANSVKDLIKKREQKEGLKNIFFKKLDKNFLELSKEEQVKRIVKILERQGFKLKK